ncbi:AMP-binding protein [Pseudofrankia inefficax]|uniref:AMP-dependent synthetase and ligase n=1 Tax=Pseudofrankia inefficax (strain DSM 45817 / CECT 9037 / DDB 130130 / EuI1c) TaxID=298654 RepID=E3IVE2_PSEI1|nr:AMP-binding protein [Pseudofrankia inefficax]ADP81306.1 AMP-dependent synthetase and ligase [Pseudofrankia inefficax]
MTQVSHRARSVQDLVLGRAGDQRIGLVFENRSWTWEEVTRASAQRAHVLRSLRRDGPFHIGVLLENVPDFLFLLGGAALAGATVVGINPTRRGTELERDIRHTDCQLIVTDERRATLLDELDVALPRDRVLDVTDPAWAVRLAASDVALTEDPVEPEDLFMLIFTSGSTGAPKAVRVSHQRLARTGSLGFSTEDVLYCAMPLFHGNALASCWVPALASGARIVLRRRFSATGFLPDVLANRVTFFNTVGRALSYVLATPPSPDDAHTTLKLVLAPEASPRDAEAFRQRFGCRVVEGYGSSEGTIVLHPRRGAPPGSLGKPVGNADIAVVDPRTRVERVPAVIDADGRVLNPDEAIGEIVRRDVGASFEGYYNNDQAQAERVRDGWFFSGDLGYRDSEGWFFFAGRQGDWIRVDGENFAASSVERIMERLPGASGVAVYGVPDAHSGDQVMATVEMADPASFDPSEFAAFLADQRDLGTKWAPRFVRVIGRLPVTGTNKIDRQRLRALRWLPADWAADIIWWRPDPRASANYVQMTERDADRLAAEFVRNGRSSVLLGQPAVGGLADSRHPRQTQ